MDEKTDKQLVSEYLDGKESALGELIERHLKPVYNFVHQAANNAQDAQDITQETFIKAWKNLKRYDPNQNFKTWLFTIARNTAIDVLRKKKNFVFSDFENIDGQNPLLETLTSPALPPDQLALQTETQAFFSHALGSLSPAYQEVLKLHHEQDLTFERAGHLLGRPLNTVKSQYRRALLVLRKILSAPK